METLSSIGSSLMVLILYSSINVIKVLLIQWSFYLFPSFVNAVNSVYNTSLDKSLNFDYSNFRRITAFISSMIQFLSMFIWAAFQFVESERGIIWLVPLSVFLLSFTSWPSYVHHNSSLKLISKLAEARDNISECGHEFCQFVLSIWKIVLTFVIISIFIFIDDGVYMNFDMNQLFEFNELIEISYNGTNDFHESVQRARILPIDVITVYIITSIISGHLYNRFILKIQSKRVYTYFVSLTIAPIALLITFLTIHFSYNNFCERITKLPHLSFLNLHNINDKNLIYIYIPLSIVTFISYIGTVWNTNWILTKLRNLSNFKGNKSIANIPSIFFESKIVSLRKFSKKKYHVFLFPTMWHEEDFEMEALIGSLMILFDEHQKLAPNYTIETQIFIDDAFDEVKDRNGRTDYVINSYVKDLIKITDQKNNEFSSQKLTYSKIKTPYGQQIHFHLANNYKFIVHLKNKNFIRKGIFIF
jgi:hypothetical protein